MKTPPQIIQLELLGLGENYHSPVDGRRGGIQIGYGFDGYTIGWRAMRLVKRDYKLFLRQCNPRSVYIKKILKGLMERDKMVISRSEPWIIKVNVKPIANR